VRLARFLAVVVLASATACAASAAGHTPIRFGITGGNLSGYHVTIQPNGGIRVTGSQRAAKRKITPARVRQLRREIRHAHLASLRCPGVLPDFASHYIGLGDLTFTVHGGCEARFQRVWNALLQAIGLRSD
jgi:hypothetical protein